MSVTIYSRILKKESKLSAKRAQYVSKRNQNRLQAQIDAFHQYKYSNKAPSLEMLISEARTYAKDDQRRLDALQAVYRHHGGLGASIDARLRRIGIDIEYGTISGFLWEAINILPDEWEQSRGSIVNALFTITRRLATKYRDDHFYRGGVLVPARETARDEQGKVIRTKSGANKRIPTRFAGVAINTDYDLIALKDICADFDQNYTTCNILGL